MAVGTSDVVDVDTARTEQVGVVEVVLAAGLDIEVDEPGVGEHET